MKRLLQLSAFALLTYSSMTPAFAQDLDADGERLKAMFEKLIERQENAPAYPIKFEGDVAVEQSGEYYAVTLPYATIDYPDGSKFEIGMVAINASAHEQDDQWKMTFAIPTPLQYTDAKDGQGFILNIGGQRASGIYSDTLGYFSKLDANYKDISMSDRENEFTFNMPEARVVYDLDSDENGKWSGPVYFSSKDLNLNIPAQGGEIFKMGGLNLNMEMFKYDPASMVAYQEQIQKLALTEDGKTKVEPAVMGELVGAFFELIGDGFTSEYQMSDIEIKGGEKQKFDTVKLDNVNFGFDMTGFLQNSVAFDLRLGYDGFDIQPLPENYPEVAPKDFNIDLAIENIPFKEISELGQSTAEIAMSNPQMAQMAGMSVLFKLPALLSEAGTSLVIDNNYLGNDAYRVDIDGKVVTDLKAVNSATADIIGKIKNLDTLMASLGEYIQTNPDDKQMMQALMGLQMAKGFGEQQTDENGDPIHVFKFIMNPQGQMLLNGNDMSVLMGMPAGGKVPAPAPAP